MANTIIAWTDYTLNPWMGCAKVSEGCRHCYAETLTSNRMGLRLWGHGKKRQVTKSPWDKIREQNSAASSGAVGVFGSGKPRLVFIGSLMDWAEDNDSVVEARKRMWDVVRMSKDCHFQMLTKRAENIRKYLPSDWGGGYDNVWLGVSVEDDRVGYRVDLLREIPAVVRFVSYEPALGPIDTVSLAGIDWVIYGGESGPGYRPEDKAWARSVRDRCAENGIAFFHKQSAAPRTEMGIELDGEIIRQFPVPSVL